MSALIEPRRPTLTMSPKVSADVGSPTTQWSMTSPSAASASTTSRVPWVATPSSSPVIRNEIEPVTLPAAMASAQAAAKAAMALFMSTAPRPISTPSTTSAPKASFDQAAASPTGHNVGVAGEAEIGPGGAVAGVEVLDLAELHPPTGETQPLQGVLDDGHRAGVGGGHRRAADQLAGQFDGVDDCSVPEAEFARLGLSSRPE